MSAYKKTSPYYGTKVKQNQYLDILRIRAIPASDDDPLYEIEPIYTHRPDLLAQAVYGTPKLWWVFAQRNMDVLKDPVFDLIPGVKIYIPQEAALKRTLGI
jgi:hypothetical protein